MNFEFAVNLFIILNRLQKNFYNKLNKQKNDIKKIIFKFITYDPNKLDNDQGEDFGDDYEDWEAELSDEEDFIDDIESDASWKVRKSAIELLKVLL